ncbi:MAG: hypothetical protein ACYTKD_29175, partial [Planctomycetota bacterium]
MRKHPYGARYWPRFLPRFTDGSDARNAAYPSYPFGEQTRTHMARYRDSLPQLTGDFFLTDAGIETDIIFN